MAHSLHSNSLQKLNDSISPELESDLELLRIFLGKKTIKILKKNDEYIVVPIVLNVDLPPRGTINNIDIRSKENIQIVFNRLKYPDIPPQVYSDRKDFPKEGISHLYVSKQGEPAPFCLVRGNYIEWFAGKKITDLIIRTKNWLRDAASGSLVIDGGQFDPMRLDGYKGSIIYDYDKLNKEIESDKTFDGAKQFTLLLLRENEKPDQNTDTIIYPKYQVLETITTKSQLKEILKLIDLKLLQNSFGLGIKRLLLGAMFWDSELKINNQFPKFLPKNLNELFNFCQDHQVDLEPLLDIIPIFKRGIKEFPVLVGVKRPKPIIGYSNDIEFFNFYLTFENGTIENKKIIKSVPVGFQSHNQPLSVSKAQQVSGSKDLIKNSVIFGCGAVGSKVVTHLIRDGKVDQIMLLFDKDNVEPHNLVRFGLLDESIGLNKAIALQNTAKRFFESEKSNSKLIGVPENGNNFFENKNFENIIPSFNWIMDFTASTSFENYFIKRKLHVSNRVCKSFITDQGNLGIQLFEGEHRNPRIDDLKIILKSSYRTNREISNWLKRERELNKQESVLVNVGVGCNSETTIISDDLISLHSATFVQAIKAQSKKKAIKKGLVKLTKVDVDNGDFNIRTESILISPLTILRDTSSVWEIRMKAGIEDLLLLKMREAMPNETGGAFIGVINTKTKCIHITDVILAPPDSKANSDCFIRGIQGLQEQVNVYKKESGQTFGYIGEWHSHPYGPLEPSTKDIETMNRFKKNYIREKEFIPVLVIIVTPTGLITCIK